MCYRDGVGAPVDLQKAMHYFLQAAELGHMPYYYNTCAAIVELKAQEGKEEEAEHSLALFRQNARYQSSQFARFVSKKNTSFLEHAQ
jgi:TPR repeat protein